MANQPGLEGSLEAHVTRVPQGDHAVVPAAQRHERHALVTSRFASRAGAVGALALGAIALGAFAIGALAIGRLAIGRARIGRLEIDELVVKRRLDV